MGNLLHVKVHAANQHDTIAGPDIIQETIAKYPSIQALSADAGYCGTTFNFVQNILNKTLHISPKIKHVWSVLPKRWIVERTFAWINNSRRLAKDFEIKIPIAENFVRLSLLKITIDQILNS